MVISSHPLERQAVALDAFSCYHHGTDNPLVQPTPCKHIVWFCLQCLKKLREKLKRKRFTLTHSAANSAPFDGPHWPSDSAPLYVSLDLVVHSMLLSPSTLTHGRYMGHEGSCSFAVWPLLVLEKCSQPNISTVDCQWSSKIFEPHYLSGLMHKLYCHGLHSGWSLDGESKHIQALDSHACCALDWDDMTCRYQWTWASQGNIQS